MDMPRSNATLSPEEQPAHEEGLHTRQDITPFRAAISPYDMEFQELRFTVTTKDKTRLEILKGVSGSCTCGRLLAILGQSGAGKTTLLDILAQNVYAGSVAGQVLVGGQPRRRRDFRKVSCYVMQREVLLESATVRESLVTSALLQLPKEMSRAAKLERVATVLQELDLEDAADVLIGDETLGLKGISGGQRRRVSVGVELVKDPRIMFLDEPTSGLDSETAIMIVATLVKLARKQRTVVCTIHQPNSDITDSFDDFMLLSAGRTVYFGPWASAVDYFAGIGHPCPTYKNPTDFFMSLCASSESSAKLSDAYQQSEMQRAKLLPGSDPEVGLSEPAGIPREPSASAQALAKDDGAVPGAPLWYQTYILTLRFWRSWIRNPIMFSSELTQYLFLGVFIGLMYLRMDSSTGAGVFDRSASFWFALAVLSFTPSFTACTIWDKERLLLRRENATGLYRLAAFYAAKTLTTTPFEIALTVLFGLVTYFMVGYQRDFGKLCVYLGVFIMFQLLSETIGQICALLTRNSTYAVVLLTFVLLLLLSFSGFLITSTPVYFRWLAKISYLTFAFAALMKNELEGLVLTDESGQKVLGQDYVPASLDNGLSVGENSVILLALVIGARLGAFAGLCLMSHLRRL